MPDYSKQLVIADRVAAMELTDPVQLVVVGWLTLRVSGRRPG